MSHHAVLHAEAAFNLGPNHVRVNGVRTMSGVASVELSSRFEDFGLGDPIPIALRLDVHLAGSTTLDHAVADAEAVAAFVVPPLALAANAGTTDPRLSIVFDDDGDEDEHRMRFVGTAREVDPVTTGSRLLPPDAALAVLSALEAHAEWLRLHRAMVHYGEALMNWQPGRELRAVESLFVAVENLTPAVLRMHMRSTGVDKATLRAEWASLMPDNRCSSCGVEYHSEGALQSAARRALLFPGNDELLTEARKISDALEHGFDSFPRMHAAAKNCRDDLARVVRSRLLELLDLTPTVLSALTGAPFASPQRRDQAVPGMAATLVGPASSLAPPGEGSPIVGVGVTRTRASLHPDGTVELQEDHKWDFKFGDGVRAEDCVFMISDRATDSSVVDQVHARAGDAPGSRRVPGMVPTLVASEAGVGQPRG